MGSLIPETTRRSRHPEVVTRIARYFYSWGLTDGPALAASTYAVVRRASTAGRTGLIEAMEFAMNEVDNWVDFLTSNLTLPPDRELRRLGVVARLREALAKYPELFLEHDLPEAFLEILRKPTPCVTPPPMPSAMTPCDLGKQPPMFRSGYWLRFFRRAGAKLNTLTHRRPLPPPT